VRLVFDENTPRVVAHAVKLIAELKQPVQQSRSKCCMRSISLVRARSTSRSSRRLLMDHMLAQR